MEWPDQHQSAHEFSAHGGHYLWLYRGLLYAEKSCKSVVVRSPALHYLWITIVDTGSPAPWRSAGDLEVVVAVLESVVGQ